MKSADSLSIFIPNLLFLCFNIFSVSSVFYGFTIMCLDNGFICIFLVNPYCLLWVWVNTFYQFWKVLKYIKDYLFHLISLEILFMDSIHFTNIFWVPTIFQQYSKHWKYNDKQSRQKSLPSYPSYSILFILHVFWSFVFSIYLWYIMFLFPQMYITDHCIFSAASYLLCHPFIEVFISRSFIRFF